MYKPNTPAKHRGRTGPRTPRLVDMTIASDQSSMFDLGKGIRSGKSPFPLLCLVRHVTLMKLFELLFP